MRINVAQLTKDLQKSLRPVYLLSGDEPLQLMEAGDEILAAAKQQGFLEREIYHVERGFEWDMLYQAACSMSLFAERKIIDLRFSSCKPGDKGAKALLEYCQNISADNLLLMRMPKLDAATQRAKWFKQLEQSAVIIQIWPIELAQLTKWIAERAKKLGMSMSPDAVQLLKDKVEGNLLAAAQEIEKLRLNNKSKITIDDVLESVADDAKYDVFKLVDAALSGQAGRTAKILSVLKSSGEQPILILWALTKEIRILVKLSNAVARGENIFQALKAERVWDKRQPLMKAALSRLNEMQWSDLLGKAINTDQVIKGLKTGNAWDELFDLSLSICGEKTMKAIAI